MTSLKFYFVRLLLTQSICLAEFVVMGLFFQARPLLDLKSDQAKFFLKNLYLQVKLPVFAHSLSLRLVKSLLFC